MLRRPQRTCSAAVRENDLKTLKTADLNTRGERGNTLLTYAASFGTPEAAKLLLDRGADVEAKNQFDATALILAATNPVKARLLVAKGANVNAVSKSGRTPLMNAGTCDGCAETCSHRRGGQRRPRAPRGKPPKRRSFYCSAPVRNSSTKAAADES